MRRSILLCIAASFSVLLKILTDNSLFFIVFLSLVIYGMLKEENEDRINYLLYFISWVYVVKFDMESFSLIVVLSITYCLLTLIHILVNHVKISQKLIISFFIFILYLCISLLKVIDQSIFQIFGFILGYLVLILASISITSSTTYENYFFHYSAGLFAGSVLRAFGYIAPVINTYILKMGRINTIFADDGLYSRFAGLDIDPNYYCIQVMLAIALNLLSIFYIRKRRVTNIFITVALIIFGLLSFSKMYIITILVFNILIIVIMMRQNVIKAMKYIVLEFILLLIPIFKYAHFFYDAYVVRFIGQGTDLDSITTGRSEIWFDYIDKIFSNLNILIMGNGIASGYLDNKIAHNMYLLSLYQLGIVGISIYLALLFFIFKAVKKKFKITEIKKSINYIPLLIVLIPNVALDSYAMDFFPFQIFLIIISILVINLNKLNEEIAL